MSLLPVVSARRLHLMTFLGVKELCAEQASEHLLTLCGTGVRADLLGLPEDVFRLILAHLVLSLRNEPVMVVRAGLTFQ